ncbi:MAG: aminotransferase class V-fold PLP-dependent enzyme [Bacteroidetes bacterium]|nr:aminotransferase class V-fold PLP-dependent enzyme [Bacteroidota bacterium]
MNINQFILNKQITFLNHGSFGACPTEIFQDYQKWQLALETDPVQFITKTGPKFLADSKKRLAGFINANPDDLVFVPNPTHAVNILRDNLKLNPGDEILSTNLEYGAMDRTWDVYCSEHKTKYIRQEISLPLISKEKFIEDFWKGYSEKTKVIFISEITSTTALKLPVYEIVKEAKKRNLITIVDGAHSVGHIPVDLEKLDPDYYTGACHKWMLTPKGSSFLWVKKNKQKDLSPLIVSWGYNAEYPSGNQLHDYHQFNGTRDFSAYLTLPKAIDFLIDHQYEAKAKSCSDLLIKNAPKFCELLKTECLAPLRDEFIGMIVSFPIQTKNPLKLKELLFDQYAIEIPVMVHGDQVYLRISCFWYNNQNDLDVLYAALTDIIEQKTDVLIVT